MAFSKRIINLKFQLGKGSFGESGSDTLELTGLRTSATVNIPGGTSMNYLDLRVQGMTLDQMNKLTILGKPVMAARVNTVTVSAGDEDMGVAVVFVGTIMESWADLAGAPEGSMQIMGQTNYLAAMKPVPATSYNGSVSVATIMAGIAAQWPRDSGGGNSFIGIAFENSGVTTVLSNPYFPGTLRDQALACQRAANFNLHIDHDVMAIWPKGSARNGQQPTISAATGMVDYPARTQDGIVLTTLFNPSLFFGQTVNVDSIMVPAKGKWIITSIVHDLEAETPGGKWFTHASGPASQRPS